MEEKEFPTGTVLSITTGRLVAPNGMRDIYEILNYLMDDNLFTHQLPRASREAAPHILKQYPQLNDVDASTVTPENHRLWLDEQEKKLGKSFKLKPLKGPTHRHPLTELEKMVGAEKVIPIVI